MSYLSALRLHFAGRFQASVSTVNNDVTHFNNAAFRKAFQEPPTKEADNGLWNPRGDAAWRLSGCRITAAYADDGTAAPGTDPVLTMLIADSDQRVAAKLADLDPQQQMVSMIFGLEVRICDSTGATFLRGKFAPAPFADIWQRGVSGGDGGGDGSAGATYQSVLGDLQWGDGSASPWLKSLRAAASGGLLSIKFNVDGYSMDPKSAEFCRGRIVGTIGPADSDEPRQFVLGRHFLAADAGTARFLAPTGQINHCVAVVDPARGKIRFDLGNALPVSLPGGPLSDLGRLAVAYQLIEVDGSVQTVSVGSVEYRIANWYENTAGIVEVPADRALSVQEMAQIQTNPLILQLTDASGKVTGGLAETACGLYVRADTFVFRLSPGEKASVSLYATHYGAPCAGARVIAINDPSWLQRFAHEPPVATPERALSFAARVVTDARGRATGLIVASDPGNPRGYIDGQVYAVRYALEETLAPSLGYVFAVGECVSVLVWDKFQPAIPVTWIGAIQPIFQQYANLYPVMKRFLNLGNYAEVCARRSALLLAFTVPTDDPNGMPVTRDLSPAKRKAILSWLKRLGPDGRPLLGVPVRPVRARRLGPKAAAIAPALPNFASRGGKYAAIGRTFDYRQRLAAAQIARLTTPS